MMLRAVSLLFLLYGHRVTFTLELSSHVSDCSKYKTNVMRSCTAEDPFPYYFLLFSLMSL